MNRVSVQVERFGEWRVGLMDERTVDNFASYDEVKNAKMLGYVGKGTGSHQLSQGIWRTYEFAKQERNLLQEALKRRKAVFRMEGPTNLPLDRSSQMMQWDIGYGNFSGGLTFRPKLEIIYALEEAKIELHSQREFTVSKSGVHDESLVAGFDKNGARIYGCIEFDMTQMPDIETTVISDTYLEVEADRIDSDPVLRFHIEMVKTTEGEVKGYEKIRAREVIERIGYDVSIADLQTSRLQRFVFDRLTVKEMVESIKAHEKLLFVIYASSEKAFSKSQSVNWLDTKRAKRPKLILNYIKKRRHGVDKVANLRVNTESGMIRLDWNNPKDEAFSGVIVIKNAFHVPCSPYDGQKLYGGKDSYTYDNFGDKDATKYYALFTYDNVPNFSEPASLEYRTK